ncbi:MAG: efflux RND transporter periplasmic adaptor subunit [Acidimicrobiia bacterium]
MNEDTEIKETAGEARRGSRWKIIAGVAAALVLTFGLLYVVRSNADPSGGSDEQPGEVSEVDGDAADRKDKGEESEEDKEAAVPVEVARAERGSIASYITASANLVAENNVTVLAEAEGRIVRLLVDEGQMVKQGQRLAVLVRGDAEIALNKARARAANAQLVLQRADSMRHKDLISNEEFDKLTMEHHVAVQEVAEANWELSKRTIRAPFAGRITERYANAGETVRPGDQIFQLADFNPLVARIYLPEGEVLGLSPGQAVQIASSAAQDTRFRGRIRQISPVVDTATGTVKVTVEAVDPPSQVRPGGFVTISIVRERREGVVLVPKQAVIRELQKAHVFLAKEDKAEKRALELGLEEGDYVEAVSGIAPGDLVITAGQGGLKDGAAVKVVEPPEEA